MADSKIGGLTGATAVGTHEIPVNAGGGLTRKVTATSILDLVRTTGVAGVLISQGTITDPALGLSHTVTWDDAADTFTAWKLNVTDTNSAAASLLLDLQAGGTSEFNVRKDGQVTIKGDVLFDADGAHNIGDVSASRPGHIFTNGVSVGGAAEALGEFRVGDSGTGSGMRLLSGYVMGGADVMFSWTSGNLGVAQDTNLTRNGAAGQIAVDNMLVLKERGTDPSASNLTSGADAKDRLGFYMKNDKLVFAYNAAGTVTYVTLDLDGSDVTWAHGTSAP